MRTEIVVPFAFDTTPIEEMLKRDGEKEAMRILENVVMDGIKAAMPTKVDRYGYGYNGQKKEPEIDWKAYVDNRLNRFIEDHAQEIIDEAALLMAARASRKKTWREVLKEIREEEE